MKKNEEKLEPIFSVSEYIEFLNLNLKKIGWAKIVGEVIKVTFSSKGHVYFSIKDKSGVGVLDVKIWKNNYALCGVRLEDGIEVILFGCPNVYLPTGRISFIAQTIELKGEGALKKAYEELKNKLEREGLFAEERKKKIPAFPERIGIITSKQGVVIHDFLNNVGKHGFEIQMIDSRVEGQEAIKDLLSAIRTFKQKDIDVLVVIRGGGSLESLQPFNNETLVREIVDFPIPIIAGIGHDKDVPLFTLAADLAVSTPSIAATTISASWIKADSVLEKYERNIVSGYENILQDANSLINKSIDIVRDSKNLIITEYKRIENKMIFSLQNFKNNLLNAKKSLNTFWQNSIISFKGHLSEINQRLKNAENIISVNNPERQLKKGYSIARFNGKIIRSIRDASIGNDMDLLVADGTIISQIKNINKINRNN